MHKSSITLRTILFCLLILGNQLWAQTTNNKNTTSFFMDQPATQWSEGMPIGNGRLGAMVYGGTSHETLRVNDDTFWSGKQQNVQNQTASQWLPEIRQLLLNNNNSEAQLLIDSKLLGPNNECYMPLADIEIDFNHTNVTHYKRELNLATGTITISYNANGTNFTREYFASYPDQAIVIRLSADKSEALSFEAGLSSQVKHTTTASNHELIINGMAPSHTEPHYQGKHEAIYDERKGMRFNGRLNITADKGAKVSSNGTKAVVSKASSVTLLFTAATSFNGPNKDPYLDGKDEVALNNNYMKRVKNKSYHQLKKRHIEDFGSLFNRVAINLGSSNTEHLPINKRLSMYKETKDRSLTALYYQFGRYLLISSSRRGSQPANLQGIWNQDMQPSWSANWTINCNAQINYWAVESANLSELHQPLFDMIREASLDGYKTAKNLYNSRGYIFHHNLDLWRTTWPVGGSGLWAIFQVGSPWLCHHIWEHYCFTLDKEFLINHFDLMRDAALFYVDNLQRDKENYLVTNPSESFENGFKKPDGNTGWACIGSAQDMQIIRSLMQNTLKAATIIGRNEKELDEIASAYQQLAPMKISKRTGELQEWNDDWEPADVNSGQVGHGWAFGVGNLITLRGTPELARAFRKTLELRKPEVSYNSASWTGAFPMAFYARFEEGEMVQRVIERHFELGTYPNITSQFQNSWQIDGNLGITAGIGEMLLQSHTDTIRLLPALPTNYPEGSIKGVCAQGGFEVELAWNNMQLSDASIHSNHGTECAIYYPGIEQAMVYDEKGKKINPTVISSNCILFPTRKGTTYHLSLKEEE